jgi:hypothetical protein
MSAYAIKDKETGLFFAGFDADMAPLWSYEVEAKKYGAAADAHGQALLFASFGIRAQKKPVRTSATGGQS